MERKKSGSTPGEGHNPPLAVYEGQARSNTVILEGGAGAPPEEVIASRAGEVLIKHTVLKADHFPSECNPVALEGVYTLNTGKAWKSEQDSNYRTTM
uniref:Uncharacterized protein n=1 Tax=Dunaliella viridis TaxID=140095 RepID=A7U4W6_9CHLO|nr:hypothetical protein [Dunaliella viridis]